MRYYTLKVLALRIETSDTVTIVFKQPALKKVNYAPGQYLTLIFRINGRRYIRPYSFSSAPLVDANLEVTVKRVHGGMVSNHIIDQLKIDDVIEVMEPLGDFTLNNTLINADTHLVLWAAGSGITPLMSIAKYALHTKSVSHVTLVYGNRQTDSVIFKEKIAELKIQYPDNFSSWHFFTQAVISETNPDSVQGRIDPVKVLSVMKAEQQLEDTVHYICGPAGLKESVKAALAGLEISRQKVFTEDFELVKDPKAFEDIATRSVLIKTGNALTTVEVVKGKSILDAGLDASLDLDYSCQTGSCMVCRGKLLSGAVKMIGIDNRPAELAEDECLLCCSFPLSNNIEIAIN